MTACVVTRLRRAFLSGVCPTDPLTLVPVRDARLPARPAARIDPLIALRTE